MRGWVRRMAECGHEAHLMVCPDGHSNHLVVQCCHVPACPWEEAGTASEWRERGNALMRVLPSGQRWTAVKRLLEQHDSVPKMRHQPERGAVFNWRMITVALRGAGDLLHDIGATLRLRPRLARWLRNHHGAVAQFWALDVGPDGHPHLHGLVYSPFVPRDLVQRWLRAQDCTVPGCKHELADDRCDECKAAKVSPCPHLDGGRQRCNGSWVVDVRAAWSPQEVLKYSVSPDAKGNDRDDHAELRLFVYLATAGEHRIQGYGAARVKAIREVEQHVEDIFVKGFCPVCGQEMIEVGAGKWKHGRYEWRLRL